MFIKRNIINQLSRFKNKLIFISGPRQAGKTFIVNHELKPTLTLNMDVASDRINFKKFPEHIINWYKTNIGPFPEEEQVEKPLIFIDEIHKTKGWRNIIKGTFDKTHHAINYIASGSSAFKLRKQDKGDSLAGRAIWLNLFPVSFREYMKSVQPDIDIGDPWKGEGSLIDACRSNVKYSARLREIWDEYVEFGSFPENLTVKDEVFYKQWLEDYISAMLDRDLKDLHTAKDTERVFQVFELLIEGLGSTYSLNSLAKTISVSPNTIKSDILAIKKILWGFELPVANVSKVKQIRKEKKIYPMDFCFTKYSEPIITGAGFESIVACTLYRGLYSEISGILSNMQLGFYRDYSQREVDFILQTKKEILLAIECKLKAKQEAKNLSFFARNKPREAILTVEEPGVFESTNDYYVVSIELLAPCLA